MNESTTDKHGPQSVPTRQSDEGTGCRVIDVFEEGQQIDGALAEAVADALSFHKRMGNPVATWSDGQVKLVPADEIPV